MMQQLIDPEVFAELKEATGNEFVAELVETFLDEAPGMITELKTAILEEDRDCYRRAAHSIKSNASTFGASALAELARDLELGDLPERGDFSGVNPLQTSFEITAEKLRSLINA